MNLVLKNKVSRTLLRFANWSQDKRFSITYFVEKGMVALDKGVVERAPVRNMF